eukprot:s2031_g14.t1
MCPIFAPFSGQPMKFRDEPEKFSTERVGRARAGHTLGEVVAKELMTTRSDRQIVDVAVNKLLDRVEEAVQTHDLTQQGEAVEAVKRGLEHLKDVQDYVEEDMEKLQTEQKLLDLELQEAEKFPLYPSRDYVVAEAPRPDEPAPPETIIGTMDTGVPKAADLSQISYKIG